MPNNSINIEGIGIITAFGNNINESIKNNKPINNNAHIEENSYDSILNRRQLKKIDKFTALAITSIKLAFDDANVTGQQPEAGLIIGNIFGGWDYVVNGIHELYKGDFSAINPYVATAWFPAAPQGEASILFGYGGYSKTISAGSLSAAFAIEHGIHMLNENKLQYVCCGGVETPNNPIIHNATKNEAQENTNIADASAFYCLTNNDHDNPHYKFSVSSLIISRNINECLSLFKKYGNEVCAFILSGNFDYELLPTGEGALYLTDEIFGHAYGAAFSLDLYVAYQACQLNQGTSFILRKGDDGQYAACLVQIKKNKYRD